MSVVRAIAEWYRYRTLGTQDHAVTGYQIALRSSWDLLAALELHELLGLQFSDDAKRFLVTTEEGLSLEALRDYLLARNDRINARACQHRKFGDKVKPPKRWMASVLIAPGDDEPPDPPEEADLSNPDPASAYVIQIQWAEIDAEEGVLPSDPVEGTPG